MTAKQRAKIYTKVAQKIDADMDGFWPVCSELIDYKNESEDVQDIIENVFPEFFLFQDNIFWAGLWWGNGKEGNKARILALLLSEQIALNP